MEEVEEILKKLFENNSLNNRNEKVAYTLGYLEICDKINKKQAIQIIEDVFYEKI